ncbi:MAG: hypothetical protein IT181_17145 [Acidobacteria bacterium]|nr:hypothetical protein [Acidobacteriota bacterium]
MLRGFGRSPAASRSFVMGVALSAVMIAAPAFAQDAAPAAPVLALDGDAATITVLIKPDKTAEFEAVLTKVKDALAKSEKAERKQQAAGWSVFKANQAVNGNTAYIMFINPVVKGQEYDITRLIAEVFPVEVQEFFQKYKDSFAGRGITPLTKFMTMGQ